MWQPLWASITCHLHGAETLHHVSKRGKLWLLNLGAKDFNSKREPVSAEQLALSVTFGLPVVV